MTLFPVGRLRMNIGATSFRMAFLDQLHNCQKVVKLSLR